MTVQRRRGQDCLIWPQKLTTDRRGNKTYVADMAASPYTIRAALWPQRGSKAEVPGQVEIGVYTMILSADLDDVGLFSRVYVQGRYWDVVAPPQYRKGTRGTRHWSMDIRARPLTPTEEAADVPLNPGEGDV